MNRETVKTVAGVIVIAAIVVATYLYGNHQRQNQLRNEQALRQQQSATVSPVAGSASITPSASPAGNNNGTAPVASVQPNTIQGGSSNGATQSLTPSSTEPSVSLSQGNVTGTAAQGTQSLADTGAGLNTAIGVSVMAMAAMIFLRSRRAVVAAVRISADR